jgi:hypothetical protein
MCASHLLPLGKDCSRYWIPVMIIVVELAFYHTADFRDGVQVRLNCFLLLLRDLWLCCLNPVSIALI